MSQIMTGGIIVAVILALSLLAGTWSKGLAIGYTDTSADFGGQGVVIPAGLNPDNLQVTKISPGEISFAPVKFMGPLLDIRFTVDNKELTLPTSLTYVYFNMNGIERSAWDQGSASIYYLDLSTNSWTPCGTTFLVGAANPSNGRLACIIPQFTRYGLGISPVPQSVKPGAVVSEGVENARYTENTALIGNQGIYVAAGIDRDHLLVRMIKPNLAPAMPFSASRLAVQITWISNPGQLQQPGQSQAQSSTAITTTATTTATTTEPVVPFSQTYVFYNLNTSERRAWEDGNLSIYYYDRSNNSWTPCTTSFVDVGGAGRVACVAPQFTFYALGMVQ